MSDNIKVAVRVRPLIQREIEQSAKVLWNVEDDTIRPVDRSNGSSYQFDHVFDVHTTTCDVYESAVQPIIESAMQGFNGTIFAYGQTASGKTFTMMGSKNDPGIISLTVQEIFNTIETTMNREFLLRVSFMEVYNEKITDLFGDPKKNLDIREDKKGRVFVYGLKEELVNQPKQVFELMKRGEENRHYGSTNMNEKSSRSHTIFQIIIESRERQDHRKSLDVDGAVSVSHLNLVDLAGSEKAKATGAEGQRLKEGGFINKSLFTLGQVISQLSEGGSFVNFRDAKLTRILQNALGGNSKTAIICNMTPAAIEESHSTLRFASSAKRIQNKAIKNEVLDDAAMLKRYKNEIAELKRKIQSLKQEQGDVQGPDESLQLQLALKEKEQLEQEETISRLTKLILVSSQVQTEEDNKQKKKRRETWCPGKARSSQDIMDHRGNSHIDLSGSMIDIELPTLPVKRMFFPGEAALNAQAMSPFDESEEDILLPESTIEFKVPIIDKVIKSKKKVKVSWNDNPETSDQSMAPDEPVFTVDAECQTEGSVSPTSQSQNDDRKEESGTDGVAYKGNNLQQEILQKELEEAMEVSERLIFENECLQNTLEELQGKNSLLTVENEDLKQELQKKEQEFSDLEEFTRLESDFRNTSMMEKKELGSLAGDEQCHISDLKKTACDAEILVRETNKLLAEKKDKNQLLEWEMSIEDQLIRVQNLFSPIHSSSLHQGSVGMTEAVVDREQMKKALKQLENEKADFDSFCELEREKHQNMQTELREQLELAYAENSKLSDKLGEDGKNEAESTDSTLSGQYQEKVSALEEKIQQLETDLKSVTEEKEQLNADIMETISLSVEAQDDLRNTQSKLKEAEDLNEELKEEVTKLRNDLEKGQPSVEKSPEKAADEDVEDLQSRIRSLEEQLQCGNDDLSQVREEAVMLQEKLAEATTNKEQQDLANQELKSLRGVVRDFQQELEQKSAELLHLSEEKAALEGDLQNKVSDLKIQLADLMLDRDAAQETINRLQGELKASQEVMCESALSKELKEEKKKREDLLKKYDSLSVETTFTKDRLLSETNKDLDHQKRIEELEKERKDSIISFSQTCKENQELIENLHKQVYELQCKLQKSSTEEELARHKLQKANEEYEALRKELHDLENLHAQHEANRGRQEHDPERMKQKINQLMFNVDLTNQKCQKFESKIKELEVQARKTENAQFERDQLQTQLRDARHQMDQQQEQMRVFQAKYCTAQSEIASIRLHADTLQNQLNKVSLDKEAANRSQQAWDTERNQLMKQKEDAVAEFNLEMSQTKKLTKQIEENESKYQDELQKLVESHRSQMEELQRAHKDLSESSRRELEALQSQHEKSLTALQEDHNGELDNLRVALQEEGAAVSSDKQREMTELTHQHEQALVTLQNKHEEELDQMQQLLQDSKATASELQNQLASLEKQHEEAIALSQQSQDENLTNVTQKHQETLSELQDSHERALSALQEQHEETMSQLKQEHSEMVTVLSQDYDTELADLREKHQEELDALKMEKERETEQLNEKLDDVKTCGSEEYEEKLCLLKHEHEEAMKLMNTEHEETLEKHRQQFADEMSECNQKYEDKIETCTADHEDFVNQLKQTHEEQMNTCQTEISGLQSVVTEKEALITEQLHKQQELENAHTEEIRQLEQAHQEELVRSQEEHQKEVLQLNEFLKEGAEEDLVTLKQQHQKAIADKDQQLALALAAKDDQHEEVLAAKDKEHEEALTARDKEHEEMLAAKDKEHEEALTARDEQHEEALLAKDKGHEALATTDKEHEELLAVKDKEHEEELAARDKEHEEALAARDKQHEEAMTDIQEQQWQDIARLKELIEAEKEAVDREHKEAIASLKKQHEEDMAAMKQRLQEEGSVTEQNSTDRVTEIHLMEQQIEELRQEHQEALSSVQQKQDEVLIRMQDQHMEEIAQLQQVISTANSDLQAETLRSQQHHDEVITDMQCKQKEEIAKVEEGYDKCIKELETKHKKETESLMEQLQRKMEEVQTVTDRLESELSLTKDLHSKTIEQLEKDHNKAVEDLQQQHQAMESENQALREELINHEKEITTSKEENFEQRLEEDLQRVKEEEERKREEMKLNHTCEMQKLNEIIETLKAEKPEEIASTEVKSLREQLQSQQKTSTVYKEEVSRLEKLVDTLDEETYQAQEQLKNCKTEHEAELKKLHNTIEKLKTEEKPAESSSEVKNIREELMSQKEKAATYYAEMRRLEKLVDTLDDESYEAQEQLKNCKTEHEAELKKLHTRVKDLEAHQQSDDVKKELVSLRCTVAQLKHDTAMRTARLEEELKTAKGHINEYRDKWLKERNELRRVQNNQPDDSIIQPPTKATAAGPSSGTSIVSNMRVFALEAEKDHLEGENKKLKTKAKQCEVDRDAVRTKYKQLQALHEEEKQKHAKLKQELSKLQEQRPPLRENAVDEQSYSLPADSISENLFGLGSYQNTEEDANTNFSEKCAQQ